MKIEDRDIRPSLLRYGYFSGYFSGYEEKEIRLTPRVCYDYEIEYYLRSDGGVYIDGKYVPFSKGDISVRKPGQKVMGIQPYECYVLCFDVLGKRYLPEGYLFGDVLHAQPLFECQILESLPAKMKYPHGDKLVTQFKELESCLQAGGPASRVKANALVQYILSDIAEEVFREKHAMQKYNKYILEAMEYIHEHFTEDISIADLIRKLGLSKAYFNRSFKEYCGQTPGEKILSLRMEKARMLLSISDISVSETARICGFSDSSYFSAKFRQMFGCTPLMYRRQNGV